MNDGVVAMAMAAYPATNACASAKRAIAVDTR